MVASKEFPAEYLEIFSPALRAKFLFTTNYDNKIKGSHAQFVYNNQYHLLVNEIRNDKLLLNNITLETRSQYSTEGASSGFGAGIFNYMFYGEPDSTIEAICIRTWGDSLVEVSNDYIRFFSFLVDGIYISYNCTGSLSVYLDDSITRIYNRKRCAIMYLRRNGKLYFLVMTPLGNTDMNDPYALYKLVMS